MADLKLLQKGLENYFNDFDKLRGFLSIENILCILLKVSPKLNPSKAYVLLRGYQIINHSIKDEQLFLLQQLRMKYLVYASKMQWEKDFELYMDKQYNNIRLYNVENNVLIKTDKDIPIPDREQHYLNYIYYKGKTQNNMSAAKAGRYKFYSKDKHPITVDMPMPDKINCLIKNDLQEVKSIKGKREKIEIRYEELLKFALKMKDINADDYCYDVLKRNRLVNAKSQNDLLSIEDVVNIVGMVGSGKSTLLKVISFYLAEKGYRVVIVLNSINEVIDYYKYFKELSLKVSPLIGKSNQERYSSSLLKKGEKYIDRDIARYLSAPCILNGLNDENKDAWEYSERPCYNLHSCDKDQKGKQRCAFFDICPATAMLREAEKSSVVVTTVAGLAASFIGKSHRLFLEEVINNFDVALFDECDRIQNTLDDFFAPNTAFNDFITSHADASAADMRKRHSEVDIDRNERRFFNLTRDAITVYDAISYDIDELVKAENGVWRNLVTSTFSALTLIERMHCDKIDKKLEEALRLCINVNEDSLDKDGLVNQLLEIVDDSCREDSHIDARLNRLFLNYKIKVNEQDFRHVKLLLKVIYFDRLVHRIDNAAKSVDREVLRNNNISDFLQARFVTQQKFLPSAPMGNIFGMMYSKSDEKLKVYRQYAFGRYLMLSLPWLQVDEKGNPLGPHAILLSGSSYAPGSLQYHINIPVNYIIQSSEETTEYLSKSIIRTCGATTVISGGSKDGRSKRIFQLLYEIRQDIETELSKSGKILFIVNSYDEARETWCHTKKFLAEIKSKHQCAVLIRDDEAREDCMLRKNELIYFDKAEEKILIAPASVICRGYNILDKNANSAIRSIFFLVRPMSVPDDISLRVGKLNGYISKRFCDKKVDDWGSFSDEIKNEAGKFWDLMQKDSGKHSLNYLSDAGKKDVVATVFIMLDQIYGRSARVSDISKIEEPPRIYFADGAFNGGRGEGSFDILKEICDYLENLIKTDEYVAKALYETFYKALKENVNYEPAEETSNDGFYSEGFND